LLIKTTKLFACKSKGWRGFASRAARNYHATGQQKYPSLAPAGADLQSVPGKYVPRWRGFIIRARSFHSNDLSCYSNTRIFYFCCMAKYKLHKQSGKDLDEGTDYEPDGRKVAALRNIVFIAF
jgi:hypothetical protein